MNKRIVFGVLVAVVVIAAFVGLDFYYAKPLLAPTGSPAVSVAPSPSSSPMPTVDISGLTKVYQNSSGLFSIYLPQDYEIDGSQIYQLSSGRKIYGVKFIIPKSVTTGTNLGSDTYLSVEQLPLVRSCTADLFLEGAQSFDQKNENGRIYSVASLTGAAAGNRYEETVYALLGTNPCIALRYFVHYGVIQNYVPPVKEFDKQSLIKEFDRIRSTLVINQ